MTESNTSLLSDATAETSLVTDVTTDVLIPVSDLTSCGSLIDLSRYGGNLLFRGIGDAYVSIFQMGLTKKKFIGLSIWIFCCRQRKLYLLTMVLCYLNMNLVVVHWIAFPITKVYLN